MKLAEMVNILQLFLGILLANKIDLEKRRIISSQQGRELATRNDLGYGEICCVSRYLIIIANNRRSKGIIRTYSNGICPTIRSVSLKMRKRNNKFCLELPFI